jgi:hypothetical protein
MWARFDVRVIGKAKLQQVDVVKNRAVIATSW